MDAEHDVKRRKTNLELVLSTSKEGLQELANEDRRKDRAARFGPQQ